MLLHLAAEWDHQPTAISTEATMINCPLRSGPGDGATVWAPLEGLRLGLRIHIMGDIAETAESLAAMFRAEGHQVEVAIGQMFGEASAIESRPDMVLLDLSSPGAEDWLLDSRTRDGASEKTPFRIGMLGHGQQEFPGSRARDCLHLHLAQPVDRSLLVKLARRLQAIIAPATRQNAQAVRSGTEQAAAWRGYCPASPP